MRIRRLKLTGFKSFVDPAELVIEPGLTGIVGPNGCGKSNLLEAIRWVMGEGSPKSLRGGGMEDVIFAGTARRPARDFAEVTMAIDRADADGRLQEGEVVRRIERGTGSAYRLDGRDVRHRDVALLFADAATGAHSPALVSQGRIGAIIAARPAERRVMLEEAAGIAGLHVRRRDAEQKLRATDGNLERLDRLIGDMDGRLQVLRRQARAAERYRLLSAEVRVAEARLIYARWRDAAGAAAAARRDADAAEAAVVQAGTRQHVAAAAITAATRALAAARTAVIAARDVAASLAHRIETLKRECRDAERRIGEIAVLRVTLAGDRAREGALAQDAALAITRLDAERETLRRRFDDRGRARPELIVSLQAAETSLRDAEVTLAQTLAAEASEQAEARIAQAAFASARAHYDRADGECRRVAGDIGAVEASDRHEAALTAAEAEHQAATEQVRSATRAIAAAELARIDAIMLRDDAQSAAAGARAAVASLEGEAAALVRSLPHAAGSRVLDALRVASGYEHALAAALGDDLDAPAAASGAVRWQGAEAQDDPQLPIGCKALGDFVSGVPAMARRLAQVAVVDVDDGSVALASGQRLVTRAGRMRRWDGFVAEDCGAATAQALVRRNRLVEIERLLPTRRAERHRADDGAGDALKAVTTATQDGEAARGALQVAERRLRDCVLAGDRARTAIERIEGQRRELDRRAARADRDRAAARTALDAAAALVTALPDGAMIREMVAVARRSAETARASSAEIRVDLAALDRGLAVDHDRSAAAASEAESWRARAGDAAGRVEEMAVRIAAVDREAAALEGTPSLLAAQIGEADTEREAATRIIADTRAVEAAAETTLHMADAEAAAIAEAMAGAREARASAAARLENQEQRRVEIGRISGERFQCPAPVLPQKAGFEADDIGEIANEAQRLDRLTLDRERIGPVNLVAEQELAELDLERASQVSQREELAEAVARLRGSIGTLNREGRARLLAAFEAVDGHFRRLFGRLFAGGDAHLALIDSDDPLEAGLEIMAQPPGKRLASLTLLSGGEQALTACALIFALFLTNPAPICVLDEVDAPLDDANIERFCDMLDQMVRETDTRYLVVTHNAVSMARMHRLFGVTMIERGVSRLVSVDLGGAETLLAAE